MKEDFSIDYGKIYDGFYSRYYDELEQTAKEHFVRNYNDDASFNNALNSFINYLHTDFCKRIVFIKNEKLNKLYSVFKKRASFYDKNKIQNIFQNKIKHEFEEIDKNELPKDYNFNKFIEEVSFIESRSEISGLLTNHQELFFRIYKLNRFDIFEIRYYSGKNIEDYPNYRELGLELYPKNEYDENFGDFKVFESEIIDLDNTTITEKIIYLQKLGIIDFLKAKQPFQSSTNSLATILSAITGAKATTIQSMINPMLSKDVDSKNNPLNSIKPVNRVESQLIKIGFNPNKTI